VSWQAAASLLLAVALVAGFAWYERDRPPARVLALVAALAALAVVGRLAFAAIPNVKPTTDIVLFAGYALGAAPGFAVGAITAVVSNVFLSQGPWTAWQMAGWGAVGVGGAVLARVARRREPNRFILATVCAAAGLAFGAWMDVYQWTLAARQDLATYVAVSGTSLPYNLAHAIGNFLFCLLLGPAFVRALRRYRRRLEVRWEAAAAGAAVALIALAVAATAVPRSEAVAAPTDRAVRYLLRAQNADGGFGSAPGQRSSPLFTGWAGLGLAAAGRNPRDVRRRGGRSIAAYVERESRTLRDIGEIERTILLLKAAGLSPRRLGGRDLVAQVERRRRADGSIAGYVSYTAFGVLALRAAGESAGRPTISWLVRAQNADGGFGVAPSSVSDSDMTGAVLQALAVTGRARSETARRAVAYLRGNQGADGGFGQLRGRTSNAQSTAYAVQGLMAVGAAGGAVRRGISYLARLQRPDGSIAYSSASRQTPVWVTAQALAALRRAPLPPAKVPRERGGARATAANAPAADGGRGGGARPAAQARAASAGGTGPGKAAARARSETQPEEREAAGNRTPTRPREGGPLDPETFEPTAVDERQGAGAAERAAADRGPSPGVLAGAAALVLGLLFLLRRRLMPGRRPRPTP
jgi:energy-coupling factor transport system substrate-specific component